jgi:hypothetical protein
MPLARRSLRNACGEGRAGWPARPRPPCSGATRRAGSEPRNELRSRAPAAHTSCSPCASDAPFRARVYVAPAASSTSRTNARACIEATLTVRDSLPIQMRRRDRQQSLPFPSGWGGRRAEAGRKPAPGRRPGVPHRTRPAHLARHPAHVTLRACGAVRCLRSPRVFPEVRRAISAASRARVSWPRGAFARGFGRRGGTHWLLRIGWRGSGLVGLEEAPARV